MPIFNFDNGSTIDTDDVMSTSPAWYHPGKYDADGNLRVPDLVHIRFSGGEGRKLKKSEVRSFMQMYDPQGAPDTSIVSGPAEGVTTGPSTTFEFSSTESDTLFEVSIDGGDFVTMSSPTTLNDLGNGAHNLRVRAVDSSGNADTTPAERNWNVDAVALSVTSNTPANGATAVVATTNATATFSEAADAATVNDANFTLVNAAGTSVAATVTYDAATTTATLNPNASLAALTTYTATVSGVRDTVGNEMAAPHTWNFTTA